MDATLSQQLVDLLLALLAVTGTVVTGVLLPRLRAWIAAQERQAATGERQQQAWLARMLASLVVEAVEQQGARWTSAEKRQQAVAWLREWATAQGWPLTEAQAALLVEAAVRELHVAGRERPAPRARQRKPRKRTEQP